MNPGASVTLWGPLFAVMSSITWAIGSTEYARLSRRYSGFSVNFARALTAFPAFVLTALLLSWGTHGGGVLGAFQDFRDLQPSHMGWFTASILSSYAFGDVCLYWSARRLGIPASLTIASSYPLLTSAWGIFRNGEILSAAQLFGLVMTLAGVITVILLAPAEPGGGGRESVGRHQKILGFAFAFTTSILWAVNSYTVGVLGRAVSVPVANTVRMALALVLCAAMSGLLEPRAPLLMAWEDYRKRIWIFLLESFAGSYFFIYGLAHSPLSIGTTLVALAPVISVPIAWFLGLERFSLGRTFGVMISALGLGLLLGG